ncbi:CHAT domain-containing protein [uncultured Lacinutrix sp.]|uniref:CHAT domain-containing protein n=1 Tax=uncultured Lacinutrix sp. TaxID=574032 RepID=UPI002639E427|nr:CHAT domain-containing protein [uncultured Lacinutrix sp.]
MVQECTTLLSYEKQISQESKIKHTTLLAKSYLQLGDYNSAILWYRKSIKLTKDNPEKVVDTYLIISKIYIDYNIEGSSKMAINELSEAKSIIINNKLNIQYLWRIYNNIGIFYNRLNDFKNSKKNYNKALETALLIKDNEKIQISYINKGNLYYAGIETSKLNLKIYKDFNLEALKHGSKYNYAIFKNLGIGSYLQGDFEEALKHYNEALKKITLSELKQNSDLPKTSQINNSDYGKVIRILYEKTYSWIQLSKQSNKIENLNYGLQTINLADQLLDKLVNQVSDKDSKLHWREEASYFYNLGATICFNLNLSDKASYFIEKNKSLLLLEYTIENNLKKTLPEYLLKKELKLKKEKDSLLNLKIISNKEYIQDLYLKTQLKLIVFTDSLKKEFPEVYKVKQSKKTYSLTEIKKHIKPQTVYLSFIWDKEENQFDALFGMATTKDTTYIYKIEGLRKVDTLVNTYKSYLKKPFKQKGDLKNFQINSSILFNTLFPDKTIKTIINNNHNLVIFPDSDLQNIPFESLVSESESKKYLIESNSIHYAYSMSYLIENSKAKREAEKNFVGYAPLSFSYDNLSLLPKTKKEVVDIKKEIGGKNYINNLATKESFLKNSNSSKIIHLATHSNQLNNPWIGFKNNKLLLHELYTYKNQADLVFLNSCNSSLGEIKSGEGVYSLARGFFYSGANSVISSLWDVNDKSTQEITTSFYKYIKEGKTKSEALRQAKLDYLNTHSLSEASPYYWSSLILIGDDSVIKFESNLLFYTVLSTIILLILFFIFKKNKNRG